MDKFSPQAQKATSIWELLELILWKILSAIKTQSHSSLYCVWLTMKLFVYATNQVYPMSMILWLKRNNNTKPRTIGQYNTWNYHTILLEVLWTLILKTVFSLGLHSKQIVGIFTGAGWREFLEILICRLWCAGYISDVGTSGGLVYFSILRNNWIRNGKLDTGVQSERMLEIT